MLVSCLCPTYNRAPHHLHLLGEAVESFLRQELHSDVQAELVILNDTPGQQLACTVPGVRVVNVPFRYRSLGEKRDALGYLAAGDIFLPWDDDDISLPNRIAQAVSGIVVGRSYFNPQRSWYLDADGLHHDHAHGFCHNASAFTREAWLAVGGYPTMSNSEDAIMDKKLRDKFGSFLNLPIEDRRDWQYIYRWGVSPCHLSGVADSNIADPHGGHYRSIGERPIERGLFHIEPRWERNYVQMCREALS